MAIFHKVCNRSLINNSYDTELLTLAILYKRNDLIDLTDKHIGELSLEYNNMHLFHKCSTPIENYFESCGYAIRNNNLDIFKSILKRAKILRYKLRVKVSDICYIENEADVFSTIKFLEDERVRLIYDTKSILSISARNGHINVFKKFVNHGSIEKIEKMLNILLLHYYDIIHKNVKKVNQKLKLALMIVYLRSLPNLEILKFTKHLKI
jgi:hypothetical protein